MGIEGVLNSLHALIKTFESFFKTVDPDLLDGKVKQIFWSLLRNIKNQKLDSHMRQLLITKSMQRTSASYSVQQKLNDMNKYIDMFASFNSIFAVWMPKYELAEKQGRL